jgi:hypothetical protein
MASLGRKALFHTSIAGEGSVSFYVNYPVDTRSAITANWKLSEGRWKVV